MPVKWDFHASKVPVYSEESQKENAAVAADAADVSIEQ
jgi:hypothetical protein